MRKTLPLLAIVLMLVSCVTNKPVPDNYTGPLAKVIDTSQSVSSTKAYFFQLATVDGRRVLSSSEATYSDNYGQGFSMAVKTKGRQIPAKSTVLELQGTTHVAAPILAFGGGMYHVNGKVRVNLKPGETYLVKGNLSKNYSAVWLEDQQGNRVSGVVEKRTN